MGIFGYDEKEFAKNSASFKESLQKIYERCGSEMGNRRLINTAISQIDLIEYPDKKNSKGQRAIDARIQALIDSMIHDVQQKKPARLSEHLNILISAITDSRQWGEEAYTPEELKSQETMAECKSEIRDKLEAKKKIALRKEEILQEGERISGPGAEEDMAMLEVEYNECVAAEERLDEDVVALTETYNVNLEAVNAKKRVKSGRQLKKLSVVSSVAEFEREVEEGARLFEEAHERNEEINSIAKEMKDRVRGTQTNTKSSGFGELVGARKNANLESAIDDSNYEAPAAKQSAFRDAMSKRQ